MTTDNEQKFSSETRDGMIIDWDVPIEMDDGLVLRADVYRPEKDGHYPVILSYGPYAKGLPFQEGYPSAWNRMVEKHPDVAAGSSNKYQSWEVVDPEKWVPDDYICVRVDSRGTGRSPGFIDHFSPRETRDFYECIEWAGVQPWSNGKVGLNGISYYAMNQWQVASLKPPHLAAMCAWEGSADWYRDATHHGGILSTFWKNWYDMQVKTVQYGLGDRGPVNPNTGELVCGPDTLSDEELAANRSDFGDAILDHPLDDEYHRERSAAWDQIRIPVLSAGNWGGQGLHLRGNVEAFMQGTSKQLWLEMHGIEHWTHFYTDYGVMLQKRFFDYFLKDGKGDWDQQAPVQLQVRHVDGTFTQRSESEWPLARTRWKRFYLNGADFSLSEEAPGEEAACKFEAMGEGLTFWLPAQEEQMEITGPSSANLFISTDTEDADVFVVVRVFDPDSNEVTFQGAIDPHTPIAQGWLRASHRKLDRSLSEDYRPYHSHDEVLPIEAGETYELDVEILPTSIVVPARHQIAFSVLGRDYEYAEETGEFLSNFKNELLGCGPFLHDEERDRPEAVFEGVNTLYTGPKRNSSVLLPIIPPKESQ